MARRSIRGPKGPRSLLLMSKVQRFGTAPRHSSRGGCAFSAVFFSCFWWVFRCQKCSPGLEVIDLPHIDTHGKARGLLVSGPTIRRVGAIKASKWRPVVVAAQLLSGLMDRGRGSPSGGSRSLVLLFFEFHHRRPVLPP